MDRATLCQLCRTKVDETVSTSTKPPPALSLEVVDRVVCKIAVHVGDPAVPMALVVVEHVPHDVIQEVNVSIDRDK